MLEAAEVGNAVSKQDYEARVPQLRVDLLNAQFDLREAPFPVMIVVVGDDQAGCNEIVNLLHEWMDARHLHTHVLRPPSDEERERPALWRMWRRLPRRGELALFAGGWMLAGIGERLRGEIDDAEVERRFEHVERFERALVDDGVLLLKFYLHLPRKELRRRLEKAKKRPDVHWRVDARDWLLDEHWKKAMPLVERTLRRTSLPESPWHLVESSDRRYRNLTVASTILAALQARLAATASPAPLPDVPSLPDLDPGASVLGSVDLSATLPEEAYEKSLAKLQPRLRELSVRARDAGMSSVLVFEGWDAAGKGGAIRRLTAAMDASDYRLVSIAAPSEEEKAHHYLWRFWRHMPPPGTMLIFDRSWYGRVLVERVEGFAREHEWKRAYGEIVDFEEQLAEHGIPVLKFWLHLDPEEQARRFAAREGTPYKKYKITGEDYRNREKWDPYVAALDEAVARTSTEFAPWHLVAASDKRHARSEVLRITCDTLKRALKKRGG
jgi:polyphosphate:AMP phosphotransferase